MSTNAGFTVDQIREFVYEYELQPRGAKGPWAAEKGFSSHRLQLWRAMVFEGDVELGLVPRQGVPMTIPPRERTALGRQRAKERAVQEAEVARLTARVSELERANDALGKAIGLLHQMSEQEPAVPQTMTDPSDS